MFRSARYVFGVAAIFLAFNGYYEASGHAGSSGPSPQQETAEWVARQVDNRDIGRDARLQVKMRLFDRQQRVRERELTILTLRGQSVRAEAGARAPSVSGDRVLIRFAYPNDIKGTAFLVREHPDAEDERFLYLPALARVRRIAGAETQDNFVGSDFTYEDISGREFDDYTYAMVEQNGTWTAPDSQRVAVYRIEARARNAQARFPRVVSIVRKDNFVVVHANIYNRRDEHQKTYEAGRIENLQGIWTVSEQVMNNFTEGTRTELTITRTEYNVGLKESAFNARELERK